MRHSDRSSGRYLHPTPPQTIACSAFYEAEFLQIHNIRTSTASQTVTRAPQSLLVRPLMSPGWAKSEHRSGPHRVDGNRLQAANQPPTLAYTSEKGIANSLVCDNEQSCPPFHPHLSKHLGSQFVG